MVSVDQIVRNKCLAFGETAHHKLKILNFPARAAGDLSDEDSSEVSTWKPITFAFKRLGKTNTRFALCRPKTDL